MLAQDLNEADRRIDEAVLERAVAPTPTPEAREDAIAGLRALSGQRREPLERVRAELQHRLAGRSDDLDATQGLRLIDAALTGLAWPDGPWRWQARERGRRRRRR